jgi:hypothetical protein
MNKKENEMRLAGGYLLALQQHIQNDTALVLISREIGKGLTDYLKISIAYQENGRVFVSDVTWAYAKVFGYSLRDRHGRYFVAMGGHGYDKAHHVTLGLATFYGVEKVSHEIV